MPCTCNTGRCSVHNKCNDDIVSRTWNDDMYDIIKPEHPEKQEKPQGYFRCLEKTLERLTDFKSKSGKDKDSDSETRRDTVGKKQEFEAKDKGSSQSWWHKSTTESDKAKTETKDKGSSQSWWNKSTSEGTKAKKSELESKEKGTSHSWWTSTDKETASEKTKGGNKFEARVKDTKESDKSWWNSSQTDSKPDGQKVNKQKLESGGKKSNQPWWKSSETKTHETKASKHSLLEGRGSIYSFWGSPEKFESREKETNSSWWKSSPTGSKFESTKVGKQKFDKGETSSSSSWWQSPDTESRSPSSKVAKQKFVTEEKRSSDSWWTSSEIETGTRATNIQATKTKPTKDTSPSWWGSVATGSVVKDKRQTFDKTEDRKSSWFKQPDTKSTETSKGSSWFKTSVTEFPTQTSSKSDTTKTSSSNWWNASENRSEAKKNKQHSSGTIPAKNDSFSWFSGSESAESDTTVVYNKSSIYFPKTIVTSDSTAIFNESQSKATKSTVKKESSPKIESILRPRIGPKKYDVGYNYDEVPNEQRTWSFKKRKPFTEVTDSSMSTGAVTGEANFIKSGLKMFHFAMDFKLEVNPDTLIRVAVGVAVLGVALCMYKVTCGNCAGGAGGGDAKKKK